MLAVIALLVLAPPNSNGPFFKQPMLLGAHRGGYAEAPESTLAAFTLTARRFPNALLETDATLTQDGEVVLLHDETFDRTTNGRGKPGERTLAQIRELDAGYRFTRDGTSYPFRGKGLRIPTLAEALRATPGSRWLIDIKGGATSAEAVVRVVLAERAEARVLLASFQPAAMSRVRALAPRIPTAYDFTTGMGLLRALRGGDWQAYQPTDPVLSMMVEQVEQFKLTPAEIAKIRAKGIRFQIHTLTTREQVRHWLGVGVDSILASDPAMLAEEIRAFESGRSRTSASAEGRHAQ